MDFQSSFHEISVLIFGSLTDYSRLEVDEYCSRDVLAWNITFI